jgi:CubicO group peptidase (beta-lactamase class C family)
MKRIAVTALGLASFAFAGAMIAPRAHAEGWVLPMAAKPEEVGLSSTQLKRIDAVTQKHVDDGLVPGAVMLVARRGKVAWVSTLGKRDPAASPDPMKADSIFRIYSMTKPIVSVAVMQMVEEGRLQVSDPVSKFLPELAKMKVAQEKTGADGTHALLLSDPERPMTVQDLLRHTSGLIYGGRGASLVNQAYVAAKIGDRSMSNQEFVTRLSTLPLRFSPGVRWEYGVSTDVLGRLIEVVDGTTLGESLSERIFKPLGMVDTQFQVPADKIARAAQPGPRPGGQPMTPRFGVDDGAKYESGGGGLTSTMADYLRFTAMLVNGGELNGKRVIGKQTLAFMAADHTGTRPGRPPGLGFGLGFEVRTMTGEAALPGSVGEYGWAGNAGTLFWVDPKNELTAIYMVQVSDPDRVALRNQFRSMVQAAIID